MGTKSHRAFHSYKVRTVEQFFRYLMLGFEYYSMVSWLLCFLCFTSSASLTGSYSEDKQWLVYLFRYAFFFFFRWKCGKDGQIIQRQGKNVLEFVAIKSRNNLELTFPGVQYEHVPSSIFFFYKQCPYILTSSPGSDRSWQFPVWDVKSPLQETNFSCC